MSKTTKYPIVYKSPEGYAAVAAAYDRVLDVWPVLCQTRTVRTRFGETHLIDCGVEDGPPLVLLHGALNCALMWMSCIAELSRHFRIYALDIMGDMGKSFPNRDLSGVSDYAEWLADTIEGLGLEKSNIAGISWGGGIALSAALLIPDRVDRVVAMCPGWGLARPNVPILKVLPALLFPGRERVRKLLQRLSASESAFTGPLDDLLIDYLVIALKNYKLRPPKLWVFSDDELRSIMTPTLVLVGERESIYEPYAVVERARRLIPNAYAEIVPGAGHALFHDRPDIVNRRIIEFIGRN